MRAPPCQELSSHAQLYSEELASQIQDGDADTAAGWESRAAFSILGVGSKKPTED